MAAKPKGKPKSKSKARKPSVAIGKIVTYTDAEGVEFPAVVAKASSAKLCDLVIFGAADASRGMIAAHLHYSVFRGRKGEKDSWH